jgi:hypothetical protein
MDDKLERILNHPLLRDLPESVMAEIRQLLVRRSVRAVRLVRGPVKA